MQVKLVDSSVDVCPNCYSPRIDYSMVESVCGFDLSSESNITDSDYTEDPVYCRTCERDFYSPLSARLVIIDDSTLYALVKDESDLLIVHIPADIEYDTVYYDAVEPTVLAIIQINDIVKPILDRLSIGGDEAVYAFKLLLDLVKQKR